MNLLPKPQSIKLKKGICDLRETEIILGEGCGDRLFIAAQKLAGEFKAETGLRPAIKKASAVSESSAKSDCTCVFIDCGNGREESYGLVSSKSGVVINGDSEAGAFYGIQTLRQMIKGSHGEIPRAEISDAPKMAYRGFYQDISRGRMPTVAGIKKLIDFLVSFKVNSFQLYIEHTFAFREYEGICPPDCSLNAEEILELDRYCYENFVEFVPSISTFGHLYRLLESPKYKHLCELNDDFERIPNKWLESLRHHTINASDPASFELIKSLLDQYIPLFRSKKFNICCDETFDLCQGKNKGLDKGALYLEFTKKIINYLDSKGLEVMMWGDVALEHPETLSQFPKSVTMLCWDYYWNPNLGNIDKFAEIGCKQIVCPGIQCWSRFTEVVGYAETNIAKMIKRGYEDKAIGVLNTAWGDYGHPSLTNCTLYGTALGAVLAWNPDEKIGTEEYDKKASALIYNDESGETVKLIRKLGECEMVMSFFTLCNWYYGGEHPTSNENVKQLKQNAETCFEIAKAFRALENRGEITEDLAIAAEGDGFVSLAGARLIGKGKKPYDGRLEAWAERYAAAWRRDNKESELDRIIDLMLDI